jgi:hypothetical protein
VLGVLVSLLACLRACVLACLLMMIDGEDLPWKVVGRK